MEINFFKYFSFTRALNTLKVISSFLLSRMIRKPVVWGMPLTYSIEPTNYCNLQCPECPSGLGALTRPLGLLNINDFKKIIDEIKNSGFYIQLYFQGEPYINKQIPEMIRYAQQSKIYVSVSTNGHLINSKNIDLIIENAPDKIIFSIDGLDQESYSNYRAGGSFKKADEGLRILAAGKNRRGMKKPFIELQFIVMRQNEHLLNKVIEYGEETGVDKVVFKTMQVSSYESALRFLPRNEKYRRYIVVNGSFRLKGKLKDHCFALWRTSVITWDGKVVPCCFDKDATFELGQLNGKPFSETWKSEKYNRFRRGVLDDRRGLNMCTNCTEGLKMNIREL